MTAGHTVEFAIQNIRDGLNAFSHTMVAGANGAKITLTNRTSGANGNRIGVYTYVSGSRSEQWDALSRQFTGGTSPSKWRMGLPFASLQDPVFGLVPPAPLRKLPWPYSPNLQ